MESKRHCAATAFCQAAVAFHIICVERGFASLTPASIFVPHISISQPKQTNEPVAYDDNKFYGGAPNDGRADSIWSKRVKAGKRRTYFFDVRATRASDYFITLTESKKRDDGSYERHKIFLYKEDFNKFLAGLTETVNYVKTELMPNFDFDSYNHDLDTEEGFTTTAAPTIEDSAPATTGEDPVNSWTL